MTKALPGILVALVLVTGLAFRLARLDARPMHHDEANQAVKFGALLEAGDYRYDASDHHGPTLYYLTMPAAWLRGQRTLASLDETTVRLVPAFFGMALIALMLTLARDLGRPAALVAAALAAVSPMLTYYSRFYIQEMAFAWFSLAFLLAAGRYTRKPSTVGALWTGLWAGLAMATKETWMITLPAAVAGCAVAAAWQGWSLGPHLTAGDANAATGVGAPHLTPRGSDLPAGGAAPHPKTGSHARWTGRGARLRPWAHLSAALFVALLVACVLYSSFFKNPSGIADWLRSFPIYGSRGLAGGRHDEPWFYYLHLVGFWRAGGMVFTEALVLGLAVAGIVFALFDRIWLKPDSTAGAPPNRGVGLKPDSTSGAPSDRGIRLQPDAGGRTFWPRLFAVYALLTLGIFSAIPYKTPWNLVPCYAAIVVVAGWWAAQILAAARTRLLRAALLAGLGIGLWHLGVQAWRVDVRYAADPRNPWVYAQTTTDFLRLPDRIAGLASVHPDGPKMLVKVVAGPYEQWPLPWYLRKLERVGYWTRATDAAPLDAAPVLVASEENAPLVEAALGERYLSEFYGLRPGVLLTVYIERGLWERYLAARQ